MLFITLKVINEIDEREMKKGRRRMLSKQPFSPSVHVRCWKKGKKERMFCRGSPFQHQKSTKTNSIVLLLCNYLRCWKNFTKIKSIKYKKCIILCQNKTYFDIKI
jgi:hypothetical protein